MMTRPIPKPIADRVCRLAADLEREHGEHFVRDKHLRHAVAGLLRRRLPPTGKPGRPKSERVTRAVDLYLAGVRGPALFRQTLDGWDSMNRYRRLVKERNLMSAISKRLERSKAPKS